MSQGHETRNRVYAAFINAVTRPLHSQSLLPDHFTVDGQDYDLAYIRADDDSMVSFSAYLAGTGREVMTLRLMLSPIDEVIDRVMLPT